MYETYEHQNQGLITPKLAPISLVLPKKFNMRVLQIFAPASLRLGLLESPKNYNTYIVIIQYKCQVWVNVIPTYSIVIIHCVHQQNKYSRRILKCVILHYLHPKMYFLAVKMNSSAILESITPCYITYSTKGSFHYENNKKDNTYIKMANPLLEVGWAIPSYLSQQKVIVSPVICEILCNMKKFAH